MVFAIVTVGVLNAVAYSREMVYTNNAREKASDKAQLVADEILSAARGVDPTGADAVRIINDSVSAIANNGSGDVQTSSIGTVKYVTDFQEPTSSDEMIQYTLTPITEDVIDATDTEITVDGITQRPTIYVSKQPGWQIHVRVYYKRVANDNDYRVVDVSGFAPKSFVAS